ncbi:ABC transporter ATP-binding protein [Alphaproteobacteria bacterium]|nr:ABC transporter ATP-binding protein [Alphaproteobacteria bacterium]
MTIVNTFRNLLFVLMPRERKIIYLIALFSVFIVLLEMISASILYLIATTIVDLNGISDNQYFNLMNDVISIEALGFVYTLLGVMLFITVVVVSLRSVLIFVESKFMLTREYTIGKRLLEGLLRKPYELVVKQNSSEITKLVLSEVVTVIEHGLYPLMTIINQSLLIFGMVVVMLVASPGVTLLIILAIFSMYFLIYKKLGNKVDAIAGERSHANSRRFVIIDNFFGVYKNAKVEGRLEEYIKSFSHHSNVYGTANANLLIFGSLPRGLVELFLVATVLIALALAILSNQLENLSVFSVFIFAGYKILPAAQSLYSALTKIRFIAPSLRSVLDNLHVSDTLITPPRKVVGDFNGFSFDNVSYRYPEKKQDTLKNINISLPSVGYVGVIGSSGSGKTTFIDLLTGLLVPYKGKVFVNTKNGDKYDLRDSCLNLSYVPQDVYLFDSTILFNITLEVDPNKEQEERLNSVIANAGLAHLVKRLPDGLLTPVGDNGAGLSGGEKQRVGLARALYRESDVLVLDEVTNALDGSTEKQIISSIERISEERLVVSITHSADNLKNADQILKIHDGNLMACNALALLTGDLK